MFSSVKKLSTLLMRKFSRLTSKGQSVKKAPRELKKKEAQVDDKFIKLSKKEDTTAKINREMIDREQRLGHAKTHSMEIDTTFDKLGKSVYRSKIMGIKFNPVDSPLQTYEIMKEAVKQTTDNRIQGIKEKSEKNRKVFDSLDVRDFDGKSWRQIRAEAAYFNAEELVNERFKIEPIENPHPRSRRSGALGYKMGMTSMWDKWGHLVPLTVIQLDRCQVMRIKTKKEDGVDSLLLGSGQKSLNTLKKGAIGNFLKANVPPKLNCKEFRISPENALPVGYMIGVRHFNVGQWVDVKARSKGKGFCGAMKRWGFAGLPASHGCSLTHRSHGSTGQRQDPGRVWKGKKMAGRKGNENVTVRKLMVYKIDFENSLIYVKGSIPGPTKRLVEISDAYFHWEMNIGKLNYPTFISEKGKVYARTMQAEPSINDPTENWLHENAIISDDEEESATVLTETA